MSTEKREVSAKGISGLRFGAARLCWPGLLIGFGIALLLYNLLL